jgi:hypothetical protein
VVHPDPVHDLQHASAPAKALRRRRDAAHQDGDE